MTIRPWMLAAGISFAALLSVGYIGSAAYLFFRDDLFAATLAHQKRMKSGYEERIAALRLQVDNLTSRQFRDQQLVEHSVARILDKQRELTQRDEKLTAVLLKAEALNISDDLSIDTEPQPATLNSFAPTKAASIGATANPFDRLLNSPSTPLQAPSERPVEKNAGLAQKAQAILKDIDETLVAFEQRQKTRIAEIASNASRKADELQRALIATGLRPTNDEMNGVGGPYSAPLSFDKPFDHHLDHLDHRIEELNKLKATAISLPIGEPAPGKRITSRFGNRIDPFFGKLALHAGIDFEARTGDNVHSTGAGTVVFADTAGGYGKMVEIEHESGYHTRYGHLSKISVSYGDKVTAGDIIGKAGSTGRSTGPHVHYEVRNNNRAIDPYRLIKAGREITPLIKPL